MISKAFTNQKDIARFHHDYAEGDIRTQVVSNWIQPGNRYDIPEVKTYYDFWWNQDPEYANLIALLSDMVLWNSRDALQWKFGDCDYVFEGKRSYHSYILKFKDLTIIASPAREVVLPETNSMMQQVVDFENAFSQLVVDYMFAHFKNLEPQLQEYLCKMKEVGIINTLNQINFNCIKQNNKHLGM